MELFATTGWKWSSTLSNIRTAVLRMKFERLHSGVVVEGLVLTNKWARGDTSSLRIWQDWLIILASIFTIIAILHIVSFIIISYSKCNCIIYSIRLIHSQFALFNETDNLINLTQQVHFLMLTITLISNKLAYSGYLPMYYMHKFTSNRQTHG